MIQQTQPEEIISIIGSQLSQPIADLLDRLVSRPYRKPDPVTSSFHEGGYAASLILLLAALVESMVARDRYLNPNAKGFEGKPVPEYMKHVYSYRIHARLSELFVLRDAIVHNHVWTLNYVWSKTGGRRLISATRVTWSGKDRLKARLNAKSFRTKLLRAHVIPSSMDRTDVFKAFGVAISTLKLLSIHGMHPDIASHHVRFQGKNVPFSSLHARLSIG